MKDSKFLQQEFSRKISSINSLAGKPMLMYARPVLQCTAIKFGRQSSNKNHFEFLLEERITI